MHAGTMATCLAAHKHDSYLFTEGRRDSNLFSGLEAHQVFVWRYASTTASALIPFSRPLTEERLSEKKMKLLGLLEAKGIP